MKPSFSKSQWNKNGYHSFKTAASVAVLPWLKVSRATKRQMSAITCLYWTVCEVLEVAIYNVSKTAIYRNQTMDPSLHSIFGVQQMNICHFLLARAHWVLNVNIWHPWYFPAWENILFISLCLGYLFFLKNKRMFVSFIARLIALTGKCTTLNKLFPELMGLNRCPGFPYWKWTLGATSAQEAVHLWESSCELCETTLPPNLTTAGHSLTNK